MEKSNKLNNIPSLSESTRIEDKNSLPPPKDFESSTYFPNIKLINNDEIRELQNLEFLKREYDSVLQEIKLMLSISLSLFSDQDKTKMKNDLELILNNETLLVKNPQKLSMLKQNYEHWISILSEMKEKIKKSSINDEGNSEFKKKYSDIRRKMFELLQNASKFLSKIKSISDVQMTISECVIQIIDEHDKIMNTSLQFSDANYKINVINKFEQQYNRINIFWEKIKQELKSSLILDKETDYEKIQFEIKLKENELREMYNYLVYFNWEDQKNLITFSFQDNNFNIYDSIDKNMFLNFVKNGINEHIINNISMNKARFMIVINQLTSVINNSEKYLINLNKIKDISIYKKKKCDEFTNKLKNLDDVIHQMQTTNINKTYLEFLDLKKNNIEKLIYNLTHLKIKDINVDLNNIENVWEQFNTLKNFLTNSFTDINKYLKNKKEILEKIDIWNNIKNAIKDIKEVINSIQLKSKIVDIKKKYQDLLTNLTNINKQLWEDLNIEFINTISKLELNEKGTYVLNAINDVINLYKKSNELEESIKSVSESIGDILDENKMSDLYFLKSVAEKSLTFKIFNLYKNGLNMTLENYERDYQTILNRYNNDAYSIYVELVSLKKKVTDLKEKYLTMINDHENFKDFDQKAIDKLLLFNDFLFTTNFPNDENFKKLEKDFELGYLETGHFFEPGFLNGLEFTIYRSELEHLIDLKKQLEKSNTIRTGNYDPNNYIIENLNMLKTPKNFTIKQLKEKYIINKDII